MDYEEALAYYPAVIASGDVAAFVAPLTGGSAPGGSAPGGPSPSGPASNGPASSGPARGGADEGVLRAAWQTVVGAADVGLVPLVAGVRERLPELPLFGAAMRAAWDDPPSGDAWTRLNAFAALLTPSGVDLLRLGLATIGTALETFAEPSLHVPAAVEWFRHAGPQLLSATLHGRTYVNLGELGEPALRAGVREPGFSVPRWAFWRSRMAGWPIRACAPPATASRSCGGTTSRSSPVSDHRSRPAGTAGKPPPGFTHRSQPGGRVSGLSLQPARGAHRDRPPLRLPAGRTRTG